MAVILRAGGTDLPAPVSMSVDDEIIWTEDTGRTLDGTMVGDVVAEKHTVSISWGYLAATEVALIKHKLTSGFYPITFRDSGVDITMEAYRGTLSKVYAGQFGGEEWYSSATVKLIER